MRAVMVMEVACGRERRSCRLARSCRAALVFVVGLARAGDEAGARGVVYDGGGGGSEAQASPAGEAFGAEDNKLWLVGAEVLEDGVGWLPVGASTCGSIPAACNAVQAAEIASSISTRPSSTQSTVTSVFIASGSARNASSARFAHAEPSAQHTTCCTAAAERTIASGAVGWCNSHSVVLPVHNDWRWPSPACPTTIKSASDCSSSKMRGSVAA